MARMRRVVAIGFPHHVTQRGNYKQTVFQSDKDFLMYLEWLKEYSLRYQLYIWAYCLMPNHVHFICVPMREVSLSRTFNILHMRYAQYINRKEDATGHLWQGRFFSSTLDDRYLYAAVRYVENNPVRAGIVKMAAEYPWSSARGHINRNTDPILDNNFFMLQKIKDWSHYLEEKENSRVISEIRNRTVTGRPCGDESFVETLQKLLGRTFTFGPRGRPRKQ